MSGHHAIIATLAYFDIFEYPLTANELRQYLWRSPNTDLDRLLEDLDRLRSDRIVEYKDGFYFLPGREVTVAVRQRAVKYVAHKLDRAKKAGKLIRYVPFVRAMFVCNTVAAGSADEESDIDVLIVVKHGRIWLARLLVTALLGLLRFRRTKTRITNQICLSFYLTDTALNLKPISLPEPDIYLCYWLRQLVPVYDPDNFYEKTQTANTWSEAWVPRALSYDLIPRYRADDKRISKAIKGMLEKFWGGRYGNLIEAQAKGFQETRMKLHPLKNHDTRSVIVNDTMMKFHENDRREYFKDEWRKLCGKFLISNF